MSDRDLRLRAAEKLLRVGKVDAALASYQEVLEAQPDDHAIAVVVAGLLYRAGRTDEAIARFTDAADAFATCGEIEHAAEVYRRLLTLQPDHEHALEQSARIAAEQDDTADACARLVALARLRTTRGNTSGALDALTHASVLAPGDVAVNAQLAALHIAAGDATAAARVLTGEMAGDDPEARFAVAEIFCRGGRYAEGVALMARTIADDPDRVPDAIALSSALAAHTSEHGWDILAAVTDSLCVRARWTDAVAALDAFVAEVPSSTDAMVRLVEVSVDGGLDDVAERAQAQLASAYLLDGCASQAVAILEDLASRHPEQPQYVSDLREALVLSGEADPDATLQQRLAAAALASAMTARRVPVDTEPSIAGSPG